MSDLVPRAAAPLSARAKAYVRKSKAENTVRAYKSAFADFQFWCEREHEGASPLPAQPTTVAEYVARLAGLGAAVATLEQRLAAITWFHKSAGLPDPTDDERVDAVMEGIRRTLGVRPHGKAALLRDDLDALLEHVPGDLRGRRDRALLLVGFAGAFRRSELAALKVADLAFSPTGLVVSLPRSKTDQEGEGRTKTLPALADRRRDPVRALKAWLAAAEITSGPVFRAIDRWGHVRASALSPQVVRLIVRQYANLAGLPFDDFGAHSLRVGFVSQASADGKSLEEIMSVTGHKSPQMVMRYNREQEKLQVRTIRAVLGGKDA